MSAAYLCPNVYLFSQKIREQRMELIAELFRSPVGIFSFITIFMVIVIAVFLFFWVKKQADKGPNV